MLFERFTKDADWLSAMGVKLDDPAAFDATGAKMLRDRLLIFSRWCQVMLRFEKAMYADPDRDLNALWWDLVAEYQGIRRPAGRNAPDYASKIHIVSAPCYYHNYMMGQLFASQVHHALARGARRGLAFESELCGSTKRRRVHEGKGFRARPDPHLERLDPPRHGRGPQSGGVRGGFSRSVKPCVTGRVEISKKSTGSCIRALDYGPLLM